MKFQKLEALEKHFKEAFPEHLCPIYLLVCPHESERKKIFQSLIKKLGDTSDFKKCSSIKEAIEHLNAGSLFSAKMAAHFDGVELLLKGEMELLAQYIKNPNPNSYLFLGASSAKNVTELYKAGKKEMVVLDLVKEKPWEVKQRLQKWIVQSLHSQKVHISPDAVESLLERLPQDRLLLTQEMDKLLCYIGDRKEITRDDIEAICSSSIEINVFQLAKDLVWNGRNPSLTLKDLSILLPLVANLRSQLEMGLKMAAMLRRGQSTEEISSAFPRLFPKALHANLDIVRRKGASYFKKGLMDVYNLELGLKTSLAKPEVLFSMFCAKETLNNCFARNSSQKR